MFAVTGALLERSAAYQRLADAIRQPDSRLEAGDARAGMDVTASPHPSDPFGVREPHRLHLRLIGALWGSGALIVSGLHFERQLLSKAEIAAKNHMRAQKAVDFFRLRLAREIDFDKVKDAADRVADHMFSKLRLGALESLEAARLGPDLLPSAAAVLAFEAIARKHQQLLPTAGSAGKAAQQELLKSRLQLCMDDLRPYLLIIWASNYLQHHWNILRRSTRPISLPCANVNGTEEDFDWWRAAIRLHIIADEAGKGMGFSAPPEPRTGSEPDAEGEAAPSQPLRALQAGADCRTIWEHHQAAFDAKLLENSGEGETDSALGRSLRFNRTLTRCFEDELGSVLPKARTPGSGCTLRSMSHNFALLPPKGRIRARWARQANPDGEVKVFNILLVPYPYRIHSRYVEPAGGDRSPDDWDFFMVRPDWLYDIDPVAGGSLASPPAAAGGEVASHSVDEAAAGAADEARLADGRERFWAFLAGLLDDQTDGAINAVVLPEGALDWETFDLVQTRLAESYAGVTMLVSGLTSAPDQSDGTVKPGNYVATYMRTRKSVLEGASPWSILHVRAKHHRWRLDAGQLRTYALSHQLSPDKIWWEDIPLPPREMLFAEFAPGSIVNTLICEDLARIEPCQVALRAVGPNLVLVLLMDNAQIVKRWPYQYAGVLADDPGSSILTLTSFGLVNRSNLSENRKSREIALWREPHGGGGVEISLPVGYDAQLISLRRDFCLERTLDGRGDNQDSAAVWKFAGLIPIRSRCAPPGGRAD